MHIYFKLTYALSTFYRLRARNRPRNTDTQADFKEKEIRS